LEKEAVQIKGIIVPPKKR